MYPIFIISGPAGSGKTSVAKALFQKFPQLRSSVTYTTRAPRTQSVEEKPLMHVTVDDFKKRLASGEFLETAMVHGNYYGTHKEETLQLMHTNPLLFIIDVQGAEQILKKFPAKDVTIFLLPENVEQMFSRIKTRGNTDEEDIKRRLKTAEMELTKKDLYQYQIINHEGKLDETIAKVAAIVEKNLKDL